jgi:hypothetical protein
MPLKAEHISLSDHLRFASFILQSRFHYEHNLRLAYLLVHAQVLPLARAASILGVSRSLFYSQILPENPAFLSERRPIPGWGNGGKERRIILSPEARENLHLIESLALYHLGETECQRLRLEAAKCRRGVLEKEGKRRKAVERRIASLRECRERGDPRLMEKVLFAVQDLGMSKEEILEEIRKGGSEASRRPTSFFIPNGP